MARRRYKKARRSGKRKMPIAATMGAVAPAAIVLTSGRDARGMMKDGILAYTGFNIDSKEFHIGSAWGLMAAAAGVGVSMLASKSGANRYLSGIPFVKI